LVQDQRNRGALQRPNPGHPEQLSLRDHRGLGVRAEALYLPDIHHISEYASAYRRPFEAIREWQEKKPELFVKNVRNHPGPDK